MSVWVNIINAIVNYLTGIWTCARMVFDVLPAQTMADCIGLLSVIFMINFIDNLPNMLTRKRKEEDDDYEWIRVRRDGR